MTYIEKCRSLFDRTTPLRFRDCGKLCNCACCKGDENACVFLYPGEKELLLQSDFEFVKVDGNFGFDALCCGGVCDRKQRPLGCMIFPLFPYAVETSTGYKIIPVVDPRGDSLCPLCKCAEAVDKRFVKAVKRVGEYMLLDSELREYLLKTSEELREIAEMKKIFEKQLTNE